jgi:hypothetical protein
MTAIRDNLALHLDKPHALPARDIDDLCGFIKGCLVLQPEDRPTAAQLLQDQWLVEN